MKLKKISLINFRNYEQLELSFTKNIICFTGLNGQGKTNIVEAVSVLGLLSSFRTYNYSDLIRFESGNFFLKGDFYNRNERKLDVRISFDGTRKKILFQDKKIMRFSELWGKIPIVYLIPDESVITTGAPNCRRDFIDKLISMINSDYFKTLNDYNKIMKQKNSILFSDNPGKAGSVEMLKVYNEKIVELGYLLYNERCTFLEEFKKYFKEILLFISDGQYKGEIIYSTSMTPDNYRTSLREQLGIKLNEEIRRGTSIVGPHKDDLEFIISGKNLRKFGSKGQHKLYLVALKLAEIEYIKSITDEYPVFILDDLYSEIDERKSLKVAKILDKDIQTFITTSNSRIIDQFDMNSTELYMVDNGTCKRVLQ